MCEIAVLDPERAGLQTIMQLAYKFHEEQGDGLGFVSVEESPDGFEYETYCSTDPHWQTFYANLRRVYDDAWRVVLHGRYQTAGEVNRQNTHPLEVDCERCEPELVVHNGSVRSHKRQREQLEARGHEFNTPVDSEVIAHAVGELPDDISNLRVYEEYNLSGKLNFLLFGEDKFVVRTSRQYDLTDDFLMTCSRTEIDDADELGFEVGKSTEWLLATPGEDGPEIETQRHSAKYNGTQHSATSASSSTARSRSRGNTYHPNDPQGWPNPSDDEDDTDTYTEVYEDISEWEHISVIRVAPGVLKVIELNENETEYVYRDNNPGLYYWYSDEPTPENIDQLEELANVRSEEDDLEQTSLSEHADIDDDVKDLIVEDVLHNVQEELDDEMTLDEFGELENNIRNAVGAA